MNILLISYFHRSESSIGSVRTRAMEKYFPGYGIDVFFLSAEAQKNNIKYLEKGITIRDRGQVTLPKSLEQGVKGLMKISRILGLYITPRSSWRDLTITEGKGIIKYTKPDAILASFPPIEALEIGIKFSECYNIPLITDFRDGLLYDAGECDGLLNSAIMKYHRLIEEEVARVSKVIITVSDPITEYFHQKYNLNNVLTMPNGYEQDCYINCPEVALDANRINIVHTGRLGMSEKGRDSGILCKAIELAEKKHPRLKEKLIFHFVGELSSTEENTLGHLAKIGLAKLWGHQPRNIALAIQKSSDILMLITAPDKASVATGKIFEYLASEKPILALTRGTEAEKIIKETGAGIAISPDDAIEIANALTIIARDGELKIPGRNDGVISTYQRGKQMKILAQKIRNNLNNLSSH